MSAGLRAGAPLGGVVADFCLPAATGGTTCLRDLLTRGPVLVWFLRGHW